MCLFQCHYLQKNICQLHVVKSQAGFEQPPADDTSYEADALPTKPPQLVTLNFFKIKLDK